MFVFPAPHNVWNALEQTLAVLNVWHPNFCDSIHALINVCQTNTDIFLRVLVKNVTWMFAFPVMMALITKTARPVRNPKPSVTETVKSTAGKIYLRRTVFVWMTAVYLCTNILKTPPACHARMLVFPASTVTGKSDPSARFVCQTRFMITP